MFKNFVNIPQQEKQAVIVEEDEKMKTSYMIKSDGLLVRLTNQN